MLLPISGITTNHGTNTDYQALASKANSDSPEVTPPSAINTFRQDSNAALTSIPTDFRSTSAGGHVTTHASLVNGASPFYSTNTPTANPASVPSANPDLPDPASMRANDNAADIQTTTERNYRTKQASTASLTNIQSSSASSAGYTNVTDDTSFGLNRTDETPLFDEVNTAKRRSTDGKFMLNGSLSYWIEETNMGGGGGLNSRGYLILKYKV